MGSKKEIRELEAELERSKQQLADRWRMLSDGVSNVAQCAKDEVVQSVEGAKDAVTTTVRDAKDAVSVTHQAEKRPWVVFGTAVATGVLLSRAMRSSGGAPALARVLSRNAMSGAAILSTLKMLKDGASSLEGFSPSSLRHGLSEGEGLGDAVKSKAVRSLSDFAHALVRRNVPSSFVPVVDRAIDDAVNRFLRTPRATPMSVTPTPAAPVVTRTINDQGESVAAMPH